MKFKSLSYGIDHFRTLEEEKYLINKYQNYISSIYMGIPDSNLNRIFTGRYNQFFYKYDANYYKQIIEYARERNIKINFTLNSINTNIELNQYINSILNILNIYSPDEICCINSIYDILYNNYDCYYICSFHQGYPKLSAQYKYNCYVIRNSFLYTNHKFFDEVENRIVLNTACPIKCKGCKDPTMSEQQHFIDLEDELKNQCENLMEQFLAIHGWFGKDIDLLETNFDTSNVTYKIGNRGMKTDIKRLEQILDNYINKQTLTLEIIDLIPQICANSAIAKYFNIYNYWHRFNFDIFNEYKSKFWNNLINCTQE